MPGSQGNNALTCPLIPPMRCGERYVFRRQETRLQDGYAARMRINRVGACCIRPFAGPAQRQQSANGAGDATVAVDARCRNQTVRAPRANDDRCATKRGSATTCTARCRGAEGRCRDHVAAGSGRKDRSPDQGKITAASPHPHPEERSVRSASRRIGRVLAMVRDARKGALPTMRPA